MFFSSGLTATLSPNVADEVEMTWPPESDDQIDRGQVPDTTGSGSGQFLSFLLVSKLLIG